MSASSGASVLRRPFGLPVVLSLALHGLAVAALGAFPLATKGPPVLNAAIKVDLVVVRPAHVVRAKPVSQKPAVERTSAEKARPVAVKRASPRHVAAAARPVTPSRMMPTKPVVTVSEAPPAFKDTPRVLAPAVSPAAAFARAATFSVPEGMEPLDNGASLSVYTGSSPVSRPVAVASSGATRLLRDSTPETGSVRSKVRAGNNPRPDYPRAAREAGWEGTTVLQVMVLPDGTAGNVTLHKTSGHAVLDEAALTAVRGWRFVPAMDGHFPVQSTVRLPVRFDLKAAY